MPEAVVQSDGSPAPGVVDAWLGRPAAASGDDMASRRLDGTHVESRTYAWRRDSVGGWSSGRAAEELRDRDSNPNFRFQRPASYR